MLDDLAICDACGAEFPAADSRCTHGWWMCEDDRDQCRLCADENAEDRWEQQQTDARLEEIREARA